MHVVIDGTVLLGARGGVRRYVAGLVASLPDIDGASRYRVLFRTGDPERKRALKALIESSEAPSLPVSRLDIPDGILDRFWHRWKIALPGTRVLLGPCDVFLDTWYLVPWLPASRLITVVYDVVPLQLPGAFPAYHEAFRRRIAEAVERARLLIAISETTKSALLSYFDVPPDRVRVVPPGVDDRFQAQRAQSHDDAVLRRYGLSQPYVLYVGSSIANKRLPLLLDAFHRLKRRWRVPHTLVLCGTDRGGGLETLDRSSWNDTGVISIGFVSDEHLPVVYRGASAFVFLSLWEGFGLPPMEAMACGVPVLVSDTPALRESVGDAGSYVDSADPDHIADTLFGLLTDERRRAWHIAEGVERVARFTWSAAARRMRAIIREVE